MIKYVKAIHEAAKSNSSYERYIQDTVHNWKDSMPGEDAAQAPRLIRKLPLPVIVAYWRVAAYVRRFYLGALAEILWIEAKRVLICNRRGHDLEDTGSYAGPDSGAEDLTCKRCGFHFRHVYY